MIPYEDVKNGESTKSVLLKFVPATEEFDLHGLFLACHIYLLSDHSVNNFQYAVKQDYATWYEILE